MISMTEHKTWIIAAILSVSLVLTLSVNNTYAIHETSDDDSHAEHAEEMSHDSYFTDANPAPTEAGIMMAYPTVHDMSLVVVHDSTQGILHSKDFTYFSQLSGFDRNIVNGKVSPDKPSFVLEGIVTPNHQPLYNMVDYVWEMKDNGYRMNYAQNDFYVALVQDDIPVRVFKYSDCRVTNYMVDTLYDGVFTYDPNGGSGRAFVDKFTFECEGYKPLNHESILDAKRDIMAKLNNQPLIQPRK